MEEKSYVGMTRCSHCGGETNELLIDRRLRKTLPRYTEGIKQKDGSVQMILCDSCQKLQAEGIPFRCAKCGTQGAILPGTASYEWADGLCEEMRNGDDPRFKNQPVIGIEVPTCPICEGG